MGETTTGWSDGSLEGGFASPRAAALLSWPAQVARMLDVEVALARAQASLDLLPAGAAAAVERLCDPAGLDLVALARAAADAPSPVIPLLAQLREGVDPAAAEALHLGATSQDVVDTAMVLGVREVLGLLVTELRELAEACARLADRHRGTVMAGRTLAQQAVPITFGLKAARWMGAVDRRRTQVLDAAERHAVVQLGGAAGTLAAHGERGVELAEALATELDLGVTDLPWHAERDRVVELAGALAGVAATVAKLGGDVVDLSSSEVAEVREADHGGPGSSAMPHKRNPTEATAARAAARLALGEISVLLGPGEHEHERAAGSWQAEWVALPSALVRVLGAVERIHRGVAGLEIDATRARANLDAGLGLTASQALAAALTAPLGRAAATDLVGDLAARAVADGRRLGEVAAADDRVRQVLDADAVAASLDPARSLQAVDRLIDRALATHRRGTAVKGGS